MLSDSAEMIQIDRTQYDGMQQMKSDKLSELESLSGMNENTEA